MESIVKKIKLEDLNLKQYSENALLMNEAEETGVLLVNQMKLLEIIFNDTNFTSKKYKKLSNWVKCKYCNFYDELERFKNEIRIFLLDNWKYSIKSVVVLNKKYDNEIIDPAIKEAMKRYGILKKYLKNEIIDLLGSKEIFIEKEYSNAKEFKYLFGIKK